MRLENWMATASVFLVAGLLGVGRDDPDAVSRRVEQTTTPAALSDSGAASVPKSVSDQKLVEIAREFAKWRRVSDQALYAPALCRAQIESGSQRSDSGDATTHGKKLYFLYASRADEYIGLNWAVKDAVAPVGQTIVKQTFVPEEVPLDQVPGGMSVSSGSARMHPPEYMIDGDKAYKCGEKRELFIMTKLDAATPGTDRGWVYATLTPDGTKVLQSGAIASCMGCHATERHDRQFGLAMARMLTERVKSAANEKSADTQPHPAK